MRRDHSDADLVNAALERDRARHGPPPHWIVPAILAGWFLVVVTVSVGLRVWEAIRG
jgi:hypothetical protein